MNDITRLPKWAQEQITDLQRQRDEAIRTLNEATDSQTKSRIWVSRMPCTGETGGGPVQKLQYIQAHSVYFQHRDEKFELSLPYDQAHDATMPVRLCSLSRSIMIRGNCSNVIEFAAHDYHKF